MPVSGDLTVPVITYPGTAAVQTPMSAYVTRTRSYSPACDKFYSPGQNGCSCSCCDDGSKSQPTYTVVIHCPCWKGKPLPHGCGCKMSFTGANTYAGMLDTGKRAYDWAREHGIAMSDRVSNTDENGNTVVEYNKEPESNG